MEPEVIYDATAICELFSMEKHNQFVIEKKYGNQKMNESDWYDTLSKDFNITKKITPIPIPEVKTEIVDEVSKGQEDEEQGSEKVKKAKK